MAVPHIPDGYSAVTPYLIVTGASKAIDFYQRAFGATELMRLAAPDGKIAHAEIQIGNARVMLADEHPDRGYRTLGRWADQHRHDGHHPNVDQCSIFAIARARSRWIRSKTSSTATDPAPWWIRFGHWWTVATSRTYQRRCSAALKLLVHAQLIREYARSSCPVLH
jgi:hypothetical protein